MNKEQIYDEQISPLMQQIIGICQENHISLVANFAIGSEEDEGLQVSTCLPDETGELPDNHKAAMRALRPARSAPMMLTTTAADGSKTMTAII